MKNIIDFEQSHHLELDEKFHQLNIGNIGNIIYWYKFFELIEDIDGDIVECGIGRGRSLLSIASIYNLWLSKNGRKRKIFGYDSFEGFPSPTIEDKSHRNPKAGEWAFSPSGKYQYSIEFIKLILKEGGVPENTDILLSKGYFVDTLKIHPDRDIALLHVDGDLYQSYRDVLNFLYKKVAKNGIVVFDDFFYGRSENESWPGARKAVKEFLGSRYNDLKVSIRGNFYLIK